MHGTVALIDRSCGTASLIAVVTELLTEICIAQIQASCHSHTLSIARVLTLFANVHLTYALENWLRQEGRGFDSRWGNWNFSLVQSFRPRYTLGVDSASHRTECQEYFLETKGGRCVELTTLPLSCAWELEPPATVRSCTGIALSVHISVCEILLSCPFVLRFADDAWYGSSMCFKRCVQTKKPLLRFHNIPFSLIADTYSGELAYIPSASVAHI